MEPPVIDVDWPALITKRPAMPLEPLPTTTLTLPAVPLVAEPVRSVMAPLDPAVVSPDVAEIEPLTPLPSASVVRMLKLPLEVALP